jgi:hypothetical protein
MSTLHAFGDSFTEGNPDDVEFMPFIKWKEFRGGNLPKSWVELLSEKLEMDYKIVAVGGANNNEIFENVCKNCNNFKKDDIVIINWTYMHRFRWSAMEIYPDGIFVNQDKNGNPYYTWRKYGINDDRPEDYNYIKRDTKYEIIENRLTNLYLEEIYNWENIIEKLSQSIGFNLFFWSADISLIYSLPSQRFHQKKYILNDSIIPGSYEHLEGKGSDIFRYIYEMGGRFIIDETEGKVIDGHFGESGHKVQSELFYNYIIKHIN